ncbi:hypothetical protein [Methanoregula sp. UBA64]|jgi:hypothetical protein|uniref:hypothetical protein n=1 Tax=Methanoregula sp. UBA64 TaxID=1915554 RepID=UPI0025F9D6A1|nr:hypothetical protein [Methanoregula sp. UBA64]
MSRPGKNPLVPCAVPVVFLVAAVFVICTPAAATLVLTDQSLVPVPPLALGSGEQARVTFAVLPSGDTTFIGTHTLQMQTGLSGARWDIQVIANGRAAAQQSASGTSAFVNGYLLSYPVTSDVSLTVALNGTVPSGAAPEVTILQVTELDTAGQPVPGSSILISAPVVSPSAVPAVSRQETQSSLPASQPSPTKAGSSAVCLGAVAAVLALFGYARVRK